MQLHENLSTMRATAFQPYYNNALSKILTDNPSSFQQCLRISGFTAQIGHESLGLLYMEEIASGAAYEGRCSDLGNCYPGDGTRYKGRGPIQLTGRFNYDSAGSFLGFNFEDNPEQVCFQSRGFEATTWYWITRNLNQYCRTGTDAEFIELTRAINGGTNGLDDRFARWDRARAILGC
jgi:putative chitinase